MDVGAYIGKGAYFMFGLLVSQMEKDEIQYLLKRELEEIQMDLEDYRIDQVVKQSMTKRYKTLFQLFQKVATEEECLRYMPKRNSSHGI